MARGVNGGVDALETINAAATAIAAVGARGERAPVQKRWGSCFSIGWCFGLKKSKRIGSAIIVPDTIVSYPDSVSTQSASQQPSMVLPFIAPPSSPASFLPSETPSVVQSPTATISSVSISAGMYSPGCTPSMFAIGPYAHETQLVSPPVFSSFPTEPSTAPYTPPPEMVQLTTPSSPEVPFAQLLEPSLPGDGNCQRYQFSQYEFQYYHLQPGSPVSHLISPCSGISYSGTSSPLRDSEFSKAMNPFLLKDSSPSPYPAKLLDLEKIVLQEWVSHPGSTIGTPRAGLNQQNTDVPPLSSTPSGLENHESPADHRVSFDTGAEGMIKSPQGMAVACHRMKKNVERVPEEEEDDEEAAVIMPHGNKCACPDSTNPSEEEHRHEKNRRTITLGSSKEFMFDGVDEVKPDEPQIGSSVWWTNEAEDGNLRESWPFFPGVS